MSSEHTRAVFPDTSWSLIDAVNAEDHPQYAKAMDILASIYWPAVYAYLRKKNYSREEATEIVQGFFADIVLNRCLFAKADADRGRLRSLMLKSLENFMLDLSDAVKARPHDARSISINHVGCEDAILHDLKDADPESAFDRRWALSVLQEALSEADRYYNGNGKQQAWRAFEARVLHPSTAMVQPLSYAEIARELGFATAAKAEDAVRAVKNRLALRIRQIVAQMAEPGDQEAEFQYLMSLLGF
jgi:hypothetical protein